MTPCDFCALSPQSRGVGLASAYVQILTCPSVSRHAVKIHPCRGSPVWVRSMTSRRVLGGRCALLERSRTVVTLHYTTRCFGIIHNFLIARVCVKSRRGEARPGDGVAGAEPERLGPCNKGEWGPVTVEGPV